jgi:hypothetical protein
MHASICRCSAWAYSHRTHYRGLAVPGHGRLAGSDCYCVATASVLLVWPCAGHADVAAVTIGPTWHPFRRSLQPLPSRYLHLLSCCGAMVTHSLTV